MHAKNSKAGISKLNKKDWAENQYTYEWLGTWSKLIHTMIGMVGHRVEVDSNGWDNGWAQGGGRFKWL